VTGAGINWGLLVPEIGVLALAVIVLGIDLFTRGRGRNALPFVVAAGALSIIGFLAGLATTQPPSMLWNGIFRFDGVSIIFKIIFVASLLLVSLASTGAGTPTWRGEYFSLLCFATLGLMLMASGGDWILIYLAIELATLSLVALAALRKSDQRSAEAGLKMLVVGAVSSATLLFGVSFLYGLTGTTRLAPTPEGLTSNPFFFLALIMVVAGLGFKVAAAPFHMWAPDVYEGAHTPVAAFLSVASKAAGIAVVFRVLVEPFYGLGAPALASVYTGPMNLVAIVLAVLSMVTGNLIALMQTNIKRLLAYSGIAQIGYIFVALSTGTPDGFTAALFYLVLYMFTNMCAWFVVVAVNETEITAYGALYKRAPLLALAMAIALFSLGGIPPLAGFVGKLYLFLPAVGRGLWWLALLGALLSVVSLYYYLMVVRQLYLVEDAPPGAKKITVATPLSVAIALCAIGIVAFGIYPGPLLQVAKWATSTFVGQ